MKKLFILLPLAAFMMASCSNDEVVNSVSQTTKADRLQIVPAVQGATRATSTTTASLTAFNVKIEGKFQKGEENTAQWDDGSIVGLSKTGSSWNFPSGTEYWWADKVTTAKFTAWAPTDLTTANAFPDGTTVTIENDIANQKDVILAYNEGIRENFESGVPINFQHVLSQIIVKAKNSSTSDITVKVAGVKLVNIKNQNTLSVPTKSTAAGTFSWDDYTPWTAAPSGKDTYKNFTNNESITQESSTSLTATAADLAEPMLLMPQTLSPQDLTATAAASMNNTYLAVLVQVETVALVGKRDAEGHYLDGNGTAINFTAKRKTGDQNNNTYTKKELDALEKGNVPTYDADDHSADAVTDNWTGVTAITTAKEVLYPREGFGTTSEKFAYVAVPLDQTWQPGFKYTYTLNFSKDGIGKSIALDAQPSDAAGYHTEDNNFPYGKDYESGEGNNPGEDIVDNPTQLFFTVTVDEWQNGDPINKDM